MTATVALPTIVGEFLAVFTDRGLAELHFPDPRRRSAGEASALPPPQHRWATLAAKALDRVLAGRPAGELPPLDEAGTDFQRAVWQVLREIPSGETRSYGEVARLLGRPPGAARAVGQACGANPIPVLTPCHRVLAAGGKLGGFSGGLDWKKRLLALEAAARPPASGPNSAAR